MTRPLRASGPGAMGAHKIRWVNCPPGPSDPGTDDGAKGYALGLQPLPGFLRNAVLRFQVCAQQHEHQIERLHDLVEYQLASRRVTWNRRAARNRIMANNPSLFARRVVSEQIRVGRGQLADLLFPAPPIRDLRQHRGPVRQPGMC